jgi:hypothetical protein
MSTIFNKSLKVEWILGRLQLEDYCKVGKGRWSNQLFVTITKYLRSLTYKEKRVSLVTVGSVAFRPVVRQLSIVKIQSRAEPLT